MVERSKRTSSAHFPVEEFPRITASTGKVDANGIGQWDGADAGRLCEKVGGGGVRDVSSGTAFLWDFRVAVRSEARFATSVWNLRAVAVNEDAPIWNEITAIRRRAERGNCAFLRGFRCWRFRFSFYNLKLVIAIVGFKKKWKRCNIL